MNLCLENKLGFEMRGYELFLLFWPFICFFRRKMEEKECGLGGIGMELGIEGLGFVEIGTVDLKFERKKERGRGRKLGVLVSWEKPERFCVG